MMVGILFLEILYQGGDVSTVWRMFRGDRLKSRQCRRFWGYTAVVRLWLVSSGGICCHVLPQRKEFLSIGNIRCKIIL